MGPTEWLLLAALSVLWGGSFFFAKVALAELPPFTVVLARVALAALALDLIRRARGQRLPRSPRLWRDFVIMGALNNLVPFSLIVWGQTEIASGLASILNATTPLFAVVLAHGLTRDERLAPARLGGVLAGLAGVVVMIGPQALAGLGGQALAELAILGAALSYALAGIFGRRFRATPPLITAFGQLCASTLMILPLALLADRPWSLPAPGLSTLGALIGIALLSTALAYVIYFRILAAAGATNLMLVTFLIPVSALVLGTAILGERLASGQLVGMALIGLGLLAIDGRPLAWPARRWRRPTAALQRRP
jgi:drug/metabolite transporter (DMT)-like permease